MSAAGYRNAVACTRCGSAVPARQSGNGAFFRCAGCGDLLAVELFPAFYRPSGQVQRGEALTREGEATCYYHDRKKATLVCGDCGRFLCSLCEVRIGGKSICPSCIDKGLKDGGMESLVTHRTLYDSLSLSIAIIPLLFFFVTVITAPIALYLALKNWNQPGTILPRTKFRFVCAIICASLQIIGWGAFVVSKL